MRKWKVVALLLAVGLVSSPFAAAQQTDDDLRREVEELKKAVQKVMSDNAKIQTENEKLRSKIDSADAVDTSLEERINALAENLDFGAGTTVNSNANPITISGEFRARTGWTFDRDFGAGSGDSGDDDGSFTDARFLVAFEFEFDRDVTTHFSLQANGLYNNGDTPASGSGLSEVDLYEGWIEIRNLFGRKELSSRTGRQEIVLGNEFQFGNNDFFSGETFDGTHWLYATDNFDLHFLYARLNANSTLNTRDHPFTSIGAGDGFDDDQLYSLYFTLKTIKNNELDLYVIYFNGQNGGSVGTLGNSLGNLAAGDNVKGESGFDFYYFTVGVRLDGVIPSVAAGLDYNVEFAYQFGDLSGGVDGTPGGASPTTDDVDGFAVEAEIGITFNAQNKFRLYVRFLYAEGADDDDTGYIPLFPERHAQANPDDHTAYRARYGLMNIIPLDNVISIQAGITFDPSSQWTLGLAGIYAEHDEDVPVSATSSDDGIGFEIDAFAEYRYSDQTTMSAGIGFFFADDGAPNKNGNLAGFSAFADDDDDVAVLFYFQTRVVF